MRVGAAQIAQATSNTFSDVQYKEMRAPSFIWRVRRHAVKQYQRSLFGKLSGALRDSQVGVDLLEEATTADLSGADAGLRGLIEAHVARQLYERWYQDDEDIEFSTETRIYVHDQIARKKFARYWFVIHSFSAFNRKMLLRAVKRRLETQ